MTIQLSPEQEQLVGRAIHAGLIRVPDDVVQVGIEAIRERLEARVTSDFATEEWRRELHDWIHSHATSAPVLAEDAIDRDSIYESRGL